MEVEIVMHIVPSRLYFSEYDAFKSACRNEDMIAIRDYITHRDRNSDLPDHECILAAMEGSAQLALEELYKLSINDEVALILFHDFYRQVSEDKKAETAFDRFVQIGGNYKHIHKIILGGSINASIYAMGHSKAKLLFDWPLLLKDSIRLGNDRIFKGVLREGRVDPTINKNEPFMTAVLFDNLEAAKTLYDMPSVKNTIDMDEAVKNAKVFNNSAVLSFLLSEESNNQRVRVEGFEIKAEEPSSPRTFLITRRLVGTYKRQKSIEEFL